MQSASFFHSEIRPSGGHFSRQTRSGPDRLLHMATDRIIAPTASPVDGAQELGTPTFARSTSTSGSPIWLSVS